MKKYIKSSDTFKSDYEIKVGDIVRYAPEWCEPQERRYLHVVLENRLNPVTNEMTRWLIRTINTSMVFAPTETVDDYMIEPTGFNVQDFDTNDDVADMIDAELSLW